MCKIYFCLDTDFTVGSLLIHHAFLKEGKKERKKEGKKERKKKKKKERKKKKKKKERKKEGKKERQKERSTYFIVFLIKYTQRKQNNETTSSFQVKRKN